MDIELSVKSLLFWEEDSEKKQKKQNETNNTNRLCQTAYRETEQNGAGSQWNDLFILRYKTSLLNHLVTETNSTTRQHVITYSSTLTVL